MVRSQRVLQRANHLHLNGVLPGLDQARDITGPGPGHQSVSQHAIDTHPGRAAIPFWQRNLIASPWLGRVKDLRISHPRTVERMALCIPSPRGNPEGLIRCDHKSLRRILECKITQHIRRFQFMINGKGRGLDRDSIAPCFCQGRNIHAAKCLIKPPLRFVPLDRVTIAGDGVEIRPLNDNRQVVRHGLFNGKGIGR